MHWLAPFKNTKPTPDVNKPWHLLCKGGHQWGPACQAGRCKRPKDADDQTVAAGDMGRWCAPVPLPAHIAATTIRHLHVSASMCCTIYVAAGWMTFNWTSSLQLASS